MPTLFIENPLASQHRTPPGHPEQVARGAAVAAALLAPGFDALLREEAEEGPEADILRCHPEAYLDKIKSASPPVGSVALDPDTHMSPGSLAAAMKGVGAMRQAVAAVLEGRARNVFVSSRPPGHHAEADRAMGFCLFGNIAIAAKIALDAFGLSRVAVVDFDVHHGNGTQDLLWDEDRALFISSHQMPLYPGTGVPSERGAYDNVVNLPLAPDSDGRVMRRLYEEEVFPRLAAWNPELILISAGFDAHQDDPLAQLNWSTDDFAWLTKSICRQAAELCDGRVVSTLEGGYDLDALGASVAAHVSELMEQSG
ncbi:MAG: histone deacetylase family protein [Pseudomonadota bacterium]